MGGRLIIVKLADYERHGEAGRILTTSEFCGLAVQNSQPRMPQRGYLVSRSIEQKIPSMALAMTYGTRAHAIAIVERAG